MREFTATEWRLIIEALEFTGDDLNDRCACKYRRAEYSQSEQEQFIQRGEDMWDLAKVIEAGYGRDTGESL